MMGVKIGHCPGCGSKVECDFPGNSIHAGSVYLLTHGDGADGNEWGVVSIHANKDSANAAKMVYEKPITRADGSEYRNESEIEEWKLSGDDYQALSLNSCEVESWMSEHVRVVGPMELSQEIMREMHDRGFRIMRSGPYTDRDMHPKVDMTRFLFIAERNV